MIFRFHCRLVKKPRIQETYRFYTFILPAATAFTTFVLLSPILCRKNTIAETLHCNGDLRFFGDPFPESMTEMTMLRRTHKPSKTWTFEELLFRNMRARLRSVRKAEFWKMFWERWVCRGCNFGKHTKLKKGILDYLMTVFWLPVCTVLLIGYVVPLFSVWANYVRKCAKEAFGYTHVSRLRRCLSIVMFPTQLLGIFVFYLMIWHLLVIVGQALVFIFIDILRNASTTLSKIILILAIVMYLREAFQSFEDAYRDLKSVAINLCMEVAGSYELETDDTMVVLTTKPYEPLYLKAPDGEVSIPRRVFYEICQVYRPYTKEVGTTFLRLFLSFTLIVLLFMLIIKFQIFEEFSEVGETMLTLGTVTLPSLLGALKSSSHQALSDQRRDSYVRTWLESITTTRKVHLKREQKGNTRK